MTSAIQQVQTEIAVMKKLRHRNIVNLYEVIDDPKSNKMYLVMQYVANGTVRTIDTDGTCQKLDDKTARDYAKQLAAGLNYLHRHNVVHRDIKPDNILLGANGQIYLSDFGVSEILDDDTDFIIGSQGTPAFMSPELCRGEGSVHGKAVDMWALGVTLYTFVVGKLPFYGKSFDEISQKVQNSALELPAGMDEEWVEILSSLLNKDPKRRMTAGELRQSPLLFGKGDSMAQSRRASAIDVVFVDDEDIENAIAVGNSVTLCCHRTPPEKLHSYVEAIKKKVVARKDANECKSRQTSEPDTNPLYVQVQFSVEAADDSSPLISSWAPLTPHPPQSGDEQLSVTSPPQRPITREGSLHQYPSPPIGTSTSGRLNSGSSMLGVPEFDSPRNGAATGAKLRAASLTSPDKVMARAAQKNSDT
jgi:serine/threonine protein kinase